MKKSAYVRDKRSPIPKNEHVSKAMSANKAKNTNPETLLRKALWAHGIRGYRLNYKMAPGRPDIAFVSKKVAIFVHGCFWHRCPNCMLPIPKSNSQFWKDKFKKNTSRDKRKKKELEELNWKVHEIWECQINNEIIEVINKIINLE